LKNQDAKEKETEEKNDVNNNGSTPSWKIIA